MVLQKTSKEWLIYRATQVICVRGNHTIGTNDTKRCHLYRVCITDSNGEPNVINAARYRQSSLYYIGGPLNVSPYMEKEIITYDKVKGKEKELSCDN